MDWTGTEGTVGGTRNSWTAGRGTDWFTLGTSLWRDILVFRIFLFLDTVIDVRNLHVVVVNVPQPGLSTLAEKVRLVTANTKVYLRSISEELL